MSFLMRVYALAKFFKPYKTEETMESFASPICLIIHFVGVKTGFCGFQQDIFLNPRIEISGCSKVFVLPFVIAGMFDAGINPDYVVGAFFVEGIPQLRRYDIVRGSNNISSIHLRCIVENSPERDDFGHFSFYARGTPYFAKFPSESSVGETPRF